MREKNRFQAMSKAKQAVLLIATSLLIVVLIELGLRASLSVLRIPLGVDAETYETMIARPLLGYYHQPFRRVSRYQGDSHFQRAKLNSIPATDRYGFLLDSNDDPERDLISKGPCEYRIFMFGGSTVEGKFLASVDDTIPARLERALREWPDADGVDVTVINAGAGAFFSLQEVSLERFIVSYAMKPDHVIYFNGSNDFAIWPDGQPNEFANMHPRHDEIYETVQGEQQFARVVDNLLHILADHSALVTSLYKVAAEVREITGDPSVRGSTASTPMMTPDDMDAWIDLHVHRYLTNMQTALSAAKPGHLVTVVLQPTMLAETTKSIDEQTRFEGTSRLWHGQPVYNLAKQKYYERLQHELSALSRKNGEAGHALVVDLSDAFTAKKKTETWFGDHVHYLPEGREAIVDQLLDRIAGQVKQGLSRVRAKGCG